VNIIIVGCGRVGAELARLMSQDGASVTIIDQNAEAFGRLDERVSVQTVVGDGTDIETLKRAGIEDAGGFAAVTNGDNRNIMAAQIAQRIFHVEHVVCRIYDPLRQRTYNELGLHSISPTVIGAKLLRDTLKGVGPREKTPTSAIAAGAAVPVREPAPPPDAPTAPVRESAPSSSQAQIPTPNQTPNQAPSEAPKRGAARG
jgi:trk system potassium uptake protein TrkA